MNPSNGPAESGVPVFYRFWRLFSPGRFFRKRPPNAVEPKPSAAGSAATLFPMAAAFAAAALGILFEASLAPGDLFRFAVIPISAACYLASLLAIHRALPPSRAPKKGEKRHWNGRFDRKTLRCLSAFFLLTLIAALFGSAYRLRRERFAPDELGRLIPAAGSPITLECWVDEMPEVVPAPPAAGRIIAPEDRTYFRAKVKRVKNRGAWEKASGRIEAAIAEDRSDLRVGDLLRLSGVIYHPAGQKNPGDIDVAETLRRERILLCLSVGDAESVRVERPNDRFAFRRFLEGVRRKGQAAFQRYLTPENARIASAMILGIHSGIDAETRTLFRETGTAHLLAISGLHIGLVTGFFFWLLRLLGVPRRTTALLTAAAALAYLGLTDLRPPAIRATTLVVILCGGVLFRRKAFSINSLAFAALLLLAMNPSTLFDTGAHLSFLATGVFLWFPKRADRKPRTRIGLRLDAWLRLLARKRPILAFLTRRFLRFAGNFGKFCLISLAIWLVLLPLILNRLNILAPIGLLLNPFLWLPVTLALVAGLLLLGVGTIFGAAAVPLAAISNAGFDLLAWMLSTAQSVRGSHAMIPGPALWWCVGFYLPLTVWTLFPFFRPERKTRIALLAVWLAVGLLVLGVARWADRAADRVRIEVLSVGHGGATLIRFPDRRTVLYDCGTFGSPESASRRVSRALFALGSAKIDLVILSHADADHYNGLPTLLDIVPVGAVAVSPMMFDKKTAGVEELAKTLEERKIPIYYVAAGETLEKAGFPELNVLHPVRTQRSDGESNANSLVVVLTHHGRGVLLPGDLDSENAAFLFAPPSRYDLILAPHHGGKSENYRQLLDWATPSVIVVSGGNFQRNRESEESLRREGFRVLHTFDVGAVEVEITRPKSGETLGAMTIQ